MAATCTICASEKRAEIDARLLAGQSGHRVSQELGVSVASVYRHARSRHHKESLRVAKEGTPAAAGTTNGQAQDFALVAQVSKSLRQAESLMRLAWKHLKATAVGSDPKATNGAISAANKTLELIAAMRGELQRGTKVNVNVTAETTVAMAAHAAAQEMDSRDQIDAARTLLSAYLEAGDAHARRTVLELLRMLPEADASTEPQALTPAPSPVPERVITGGGA